VASHNSALKAHRQSLERREQNRQMRTRLRRALRDIRAGIEGGQNGDLEGAVRTTVSLVDRMAGKGLIHRNTAARYKSRLATRLAKKSSAA
jgi:small subunit ribosomal protein S20